MKLNGGLRFSLHQIACSEEMSVPQISHVVALSLSHLIILPDAQPKSRIRQPIVKEKPASSRMLVILPTSRSPDSRYSSYPAQRLLGGIGRPSLHISLCSESDWPIAYENAFPWYGWYFIKWIGGISLDLSQAFHAYGMNFVTASIPIRLGPTCRLRNRQTPCIQASSASRLENTNVYSH